MSPVSARASVSADALTLGWARLANTVGSVSPSAYAVIIARPDTPQDIREHATQLNVRPFEHHLDAIRFAAPFFHETFPIADRLAQLALRAVRNETGENEAEGEQLRQPRGVFDVGLASLKP